MHLGISGICFWLFEGMLRLMRVGLFSIVIQLNIFTVLWFYLCNYINVLSPQITEHQNVLQSFWQQIDRYIFFHPSKAITLSVLENDSNSSSLLSSRLKMDVNNRRGTGIELLLSAEQESQEIVTGARNGNYLHTP